MIVKNKFKKTHIVYDFVYRNGNLEGSINENIKRMEKLGWMFTDIKLVIDENQDNTSFDYLIVLQK